MRGSISRKGGQAERPHTRQGITRKRMRAGGRGRTAGLREDDE